MFYINLTVMPFLSSYSKTFREDHRPENVLVHCQQINSLKKVNPDVFECWILKFWLKVKFLMLFVCGVFNVL